MDENARLRATLARHGKPAPDARLVLVGLRWVASDDGWYVETDRGVYWLDARDQRWKVCPWGALDSGGTGLR